jgi:hypothetical protein
MLIVTEYNVPVLQHLTCQGRVMCGFLCGNYENAERVATERCHIAEDCLSAALVRLVGLFS